MSLLSCGRSKLLRRITSAASSVRTGYIVLVPEIGEDIIDRTPLTKQNDLYNFEQVNSDRCMATIGKQALDFEGGIHYIESKILEKESPDVIEHVFEPLEGLSHTLDSTWGLAKCLYLGNNHLMPVNNYFAIHNRAQKARASKYYSKPIFDLVTKSLDTPSLSEEHTRLFKKFQLEGKLNGLSLREASKVELDICLQKLSKEKNEFKLKVEKATSEFKLPVPQDIVNTLPLSLQKEMSPSDKIGFKTFNLNSNSYAPFLEHCPVRDLRYEVWKGMVSRCCPTKDRSLSTSVNIEEIRCLRKFKAKLLGYKSFADMSMETKMAKSVGDIKTTLEILARECRISTEYDLKCLRRVAVKKGGFKGNFEVWDVPYWRRISLKEQLRYDEEEYRIYFPLQQVLKGMFGFCKKLFGVHIEAREGVSVWDENVKFYDVFEENSSEPVGSFYLDPYARSKNKFANEPNTGWFVGMQNRSSIVGSKPLGSLVFNFPTPTEGNPSLLSFKEVTLLFNRFGQCLQHLMTKANYSELSGKSNIEWDAVEVCGNVFSHFVHSREVLESISCHYENGKQLPENMLPTLQAVKNHMAGFDLSKEVYLSLLDLELHSTDTFWVDIVKGLWPRTRYVPMHKEDSHPCSLMKIFADDWAGSYYCHLWARLIATDVYTAFEENEGSSKRMQAVGRRFKETYLASGGSCHSREVFRQFRGRDPSPAAFLKFFGLDLTSEYVEHAM